MFAALPPSSSVSFLPVPASSRWIALPTSVEPVNAILSTPACLTSAAPVAAVAGDDVHDPWRKLRLAADVGEEERGQRRRLRRLEHDGVPGRERGRDLPRDHQQREVPRDDLAGDAERLRLAARERVLELVRPARVVEEVRRREREVDVAALADRLAAVERLEHRELARALLDDAGDAVQVLRALGRPQASTSRLERVARRLDREVDVLRVRPARPRRASPRSTGEIEGNHSPDFGLTNLPPMKSPYRSSSWTIVAGLGRGRVLPLGQCRRGVRASRRSSLSQAVK